MKRYKPIQESLDRLESDINSFLYDALQKVSNKYDNDIESDIDLQNETLTLEFSFYLDSGVNLNRFKKEAIDVVNKELSQINLKLPKHSRETDIAIDIISPRSIDNVSIDKKWGTTNYRSTFKLNVDIS